MWISSRSFDSANQSTPPRPNISDLRISPLLPSICQTVNSISRSRIWHCSGEELQNTDNFLVYPIFSSYYRSAFRVTHLSNPFYLKSDLSKLISSFSIFICIFIFKKQRRGLDGHFYSTFLHLHLHFACTFILINFLRYVVDSIYFCTTSQRYNFPLIYTKFISTNKEWMIINF